MVEAIEELGLPRRIEEEYRVLQRDMTEVVYRPGDQQYFDQVLVELARTVAIGDQAVVPSADWGTVMRLIQELVVDPRMREVRWQYEVKCLPGDLYASHGWYRIVAASQGMLEVEPGEDEEAADLLLGRFRCAA